MIPWIFWWIDDLGFWGLLTVFQLYKPVEKSGGDGNTRVFKAGKGGGENAVHNSEILFLFIYDKHRFSWRCKQNYPIVTRNYLIRSSC